MGLLPFFIFFYAFISFFSEISIAADTITLNQSINDTQTIISTNQRFELGFFTPGNSKNRFLGIWYKNIPATVVWVANRDNPVTDSSGILTFGVDRNLLLLNQTKGVIWSSNSSRVADNPVAQLLDSGNFVLKEESNNGNSDFLWQSFDHPSDTLLPGMKLGWNLKTRFDRNLTSWRNADDPSQGDFSFGLNPPEAPQLVLRSRTDIQFRVGPWDGSRFSGSGELKANPVFNPIVISNSDEVYYKFEINDESTISRFVISYLGAVEYLTWNNQSLEWASRIPLQKDGCDTYGKCGAHGACVLSSDSAVCECLKGFKPKSPQEWESVDWSSGCDRKSQLDCGNGDGFVEYNGLKLPDKSHFWVNKSRNPGECKAECLKNCSCMAYTEIGINCVVWFNDLTDIRKVANHDQVLYIRMARAELEAIADSKKKKRIVVAMVAIFAVVGSLLLGWMSWYFIWKRRTNKKGHKLEDPEEDNIHETGNEDLELPLFDLDTVAAATNNFSFANKIGEGGFGSVYKGVLSTGQEIAVKRLSETSGQGLNEFKNEVILIAKLQHRNLVRLLGGCIQGEERMLIYEYMPNGSLDTFIFGQTSVSLNWRKRFDIIVGIARGLLYLHRDSRLRIIHRDLKASNVLLDTEMLPKISDFGMARTFGADQMEENTRRVVGTYGYMAPEYAIDGIFSVKSDVFSFGVLVLEIVSGKKNRRFLHADHNLNLLGHAWKLWNEGKALELMDPLIEDSFPVSEVLRCIQVGFLCVQQRPEDRPTMPSVLLMLDSESAILPQPKQTSYFTERNFIEKEISSSGQESFTANELTITMLNAR